MSAPIGKTVAVLGNPSLLTLKVRSVSCCRFQRESVRTSAYGNDVPVNTVSSKSFSTADQESTRTTSRSAVKEWVQYIVQKSNVDLQAINRMLSPLHVDLPKLIPQYKTGLTFWLRAPPPAAAKSSELEKRTDAVPAEETKVEKVSKVENETSIVGVRSVKEIAKSANDCETEKQDFARVMLDTRECVDQFEFERKSVSAQLPVSPAAQRRDVKLLQPKPSIHPPVVVAKDPVTSDPSQSFVSQAVVTATTAIDVTSTIVKQIASYLPSYGTPAKKIEELPKSSRAMLPSDSKKEESPSKKTVVAEKRVLVAKGSIDRRTRALVVSLREAKSKTSQVVRLEELCKHLLQYPDARNVAVKDKAIACLLHLRSSKDVAVRESAKEALALMGFADPVPRRGVRILSLDGGGTKGLITIEILKKLEDITHQRIHELFDYICGVSTGSLIAIMMAAYQLPLNEAENIYKEFSSQMFARNKLVGAGKLFMSHAYYDTQLWENILMENIGDKTFLATARDSRCPKIAAVSTLMNVSRVQNFLFRNYSVPPGRQSHYAGSVTHHLWQSVRASSAAPGYYEEFQLGDHVHQDGGLLTNNPTAIAIHECQLLWPNESLQCVVSIGSGRHETIEELEPVSKSSLKAKVTKVIQSATDTEAVHTVLRDLLKPSTYFRFNPYMSEEFVLDEIRNEKWDQMKLDTEMYCRKNQLQLEMAAQRLLEPRSTYKKASDWLELLMAKIGQ